MKKAVVELGSKQYLVEEGSVLDVEHLGDQKTLKLKPLLVIDGESVLVGRPRLDKPTVNMAVNETVKGEKVIAIRFKAKKRVEKRRGHRQTLSRVKVVSIT
jgi:large subunit ribosomal protein L21